MNFLSRCLLPTADKTAQRMPTTASARASCPEPTLTLKAVHPRGPAVSTTEAGRSLHLKLSLGLEQAQFLSPITCSSIHFLSMVGPTLACLGSPHIPQHPIFTYHTFTHITPPPHHIMHLTTHTPHPHTPHTPHHTHKHHITHTTHIHHTTTHTTQHTQHTTPPLTSRSIHSSNKYVPCACGHSK